MLQSVDIYNYYVTIFNKLCSSFFLFVYVSVCKWNHVCAWRPEESICVGAVFYHPLFILCRQTLWSKAGSLQATGKASYYSAVQSCDYRHTWDPARSVMWALRIWTSVLLPVQYVLLFTSPSLQAWSQSYSLLSFGTWMFQVSE